MTIAIVFALTGCGSTASDGNATSRTGASPRGGAGASDAAARAAASPGGVTSASSAGDIAQPSALRLPANHLGRIPILEYHVIAGT